MCVPGRLEGFSGAEIKSSEQLERLWHMEQPQLLGRMLSSSSHSQHSTGGTGAAWLGGGGNRTGLFTLSPASHKAARACFVLCASCCQATSSPFLMHCSAPSNVSIVSQRENGMIFKTLFSKDSVPCIQMHISSITLSAIFKDT